jgi:hypothetical protein
MEMKMASAEKVDMWFDPICPFAWITSRWLLEAASVRDLEVTWNIMSLAQLNKDREMDEAHKAAFTRSWDAVRLVAVVKEKHGNDAVIALYNAIRGDRDDYLRNRNRERPFPSRRADSKYGAGAPDTPWKRCGEIGQCKSPRESRLELEKVVTKGSGVSSAGGPIDQS